MIISKKEEVMNKNQPIYSVVIPLYNKQRHIKDTIDSVLNQIYQDFEIVVVNDGSTDDSAKVVESIKDDRIRLIHQKNAGVAVARNTGIKQARAEYIAFLDADDIWLPNHLEEIKQLIQKFSEAKAFSTAYEARTKNKIYKKIFSTLPEDPWQGVLENYFYTDMIDGNPMWTSVVCVQKDVFDKVGDFPAGIKIGEDVDTWVRIFLAYKVAFSTTITAIYSLDSDNRTTVTAGAPQKEPIFVTRLQRMLDKNKIPKEFIDDVQKYIAHYLLIFASLNINIGNFNKANEFLSDSRTNVLYAKKNHLKKWSYLQYIKQRIKSFL
jgi:glycosyltransferase involved in cell wall biosynthesis